MRNLIAVTLALCMALATLATVRADETSPEMAPAVGPVSVRSESLRIRHSFDADQAPTDGEVRRTLNFNYEQSMVDQIEYVRNASGELQRDADGQVSAPILTHVNCGWVASRMVLKLINHDIVRQRPGDNSSPYVYAHRPNRYAQAVIAWHLGNVTARAGVGPGSSARIHAEAIPNSSANHRFGSLEISFHRREASYIFDRTQCQGTIECELNRQVYACGMSGLQVNLAGAFRSLVSEIAAAQEPLRRYNMALRQAQAADSTGPGATVTAQAVVRETRAQSLDEDVASLNNGAAPVPAVVAPPIPAPVAETPATAAATHDSHDDSDAEAAGSGAADGS